MGQVSRIGRGCFVCGFPGETCHECLQVYCRSHFGPDLVCVYCLAFRDAARGVLSNLVCDIFDVDLDVECSCCWPYASVDLVDANGERVQR